MNTLFAPPGQEWQRLSPRYARARALSAALVNIVLWSGLTVAAFVFLPTWVGYGAAVLGLAWTTWRTIRAGRWARAFGYAQRTDDLVITTGLWNRALTAIPYGRMQVVKVHSGPIDRLWGLARVSLVTAALETGADIPGLSAPEATALRDRLIEAGETQALPL